MSLKMRRKCEKIFFLLAKYMKLSHSAFKRFNFTTLLSSIFPLLFKPAFWCLAALGCLYTAGILGILVWCLLTPLLCWRTDFLLWMLKENSKAYEGKVAFITGGSSGIGFSIAKLLSVRGVRGLILVSRSIEKLTDARKDIVKYANSNGWSLSAKDILLIPFDLSQDMSTPADINAGDSWNNIVNKSIEWKSGVDFVFLNAGRFALGSFPTFEVFNTILNTNFVSCIKLCDLFLPHFKLKNSGHFVFTNSAAAYLHYGGMCAYSTSKAALLAYSNILRQDLMGSGYNGVKVTSVHPGVVFTEISRNTVDAQIQKNVTRRGGDKTVEWAKDKDLSDATGIESDECALYVLRGVSRNLFECWMAVSSTILKVQLAYHAPPIFQLLNWCFATKQVKRLNDARVKVIENAMKA